MNDFSLSRSLALAASLATLAASLPAQLAQQAQFTPIPGTSTVPGANPNFCGLSGTSGWSGVRVSADGNVVATVGYSPGFVSGAVSRQGIRWTAATGTTEIQPNIPGNYPIVGMSFDGSVIYGESWRWTAASGAIDVLPWLRNPLGQQTRILFGCAWDGTTLVGVEGIFPDDSDMVRWPQGIFGPRQTLPRAAQFPEGYFFFNTISGDGQVLGGMARRPRTSPTSADTYAAVIVTPNGAQVLTSESFGEGVTGLSADGSAAVGYTTVLTGSVPRLRAFRWDATTGVVLLDVGVGFANGSYARSTNVDASVVVGDYEAVGQSEIRAFLWTATNDFVDLREELVTNYGLANELAGWRLVVATDVSADGRTIVGQGINPLGCEQAFVVRFPSVPGAAVAYGPRCSSNVGPLALTATATPFVGSIYSSSCSGIAPNTANLSVYGLGALALPWPTLLPEGQAGCELLTTPDLLVLVPGAGPNVATSLTIPNAPQLVGGVIRQQFVQFEFASSGPLLAVRSSNGLQLTFGSL
jgi:hypothetical protein